MRVLLFLAQPRKTRKTPALSLPLHFAFSLSRGMTAVDRTLLSRVRSTYAHERGRVNKANDYLLIRPLFPRVSFSSIRPAAHADHQSDGCVADIFENVLLVICYRGCLCRIHGAFSLILSGVCAQRYNRVITNKDVV